MVGAAREVVIATLAGEWKREVPKGMGWGHEFNVRGGRQIAEMPILSLTPPLPYPERVSAIFFCGFCPIVATKSDPPRKWVLDAMLGAGFIHQPSRRQG